MAFFVLPPPEGPGIIAQVLLFTTLLTPWRPQSTVYPIKYNTNATLPLPAANHGSLFIVIYTTFGVCGECYYLQHFPLALPEFPISGRLTPWFILTPSMPSYAIIYNTWAAKGLPPDSRRRAFALFKKAFQKDFVDLPPDCWSLCGKCYYLHAFPVGFG